MDTRENNVAYYINKKGEYWKQLKRLLQSSNKVLPQYMENNLVKNMVNETQVEFEGLLIKLPYIGGEKNMLTFTLVSSAAALAYIRILEKHNLAVEVIGKILNQVYDDVYTSLPGIARWYLSWTLHISS